MTLMKHPKITLLLQNKQTLPLLLPLNFCNFYSNKAKIGQNRLFRIKHRLFGTKIYASPENNIQMKIIFK